MTKNEFLSVVNDIDDDFLKELIEDPGKPQVIYLSDKRVSFKKLALSAAAVICVVTAGLFAALKAQAPQMSSPDDSRSGVSISNPVSDPTSEPTSMSIPEKTENDPFGHHLTPYVTAFSADNKTFISEPVVKVLGENYAQISLEYGGATEKDPLCISFCRKDSFGYWVVSEEIKITAGYANKMRINYTKPAAPGDEIMLMITTTNENAFAKGYWIP